MASSEQYIKAEDLFCDTCLTIGVPIVAGDQVLGTHCPKCGAARFFKDGIRAVLKKETDLVMEMVHRTDHAGEHNSSLEAGPASCRFKVYFCEGGTNDERRKAMKEAASDIYYALQEAKTIGLISETSPTRKKAAGEEERP